MSEHDSEHDAPHTQEGQEPVLNRVDYGDHVPPEPEPEPTRDHAEPATEIETEAEVSNDPAPVVAPSRPRRRLKRPSLARLASVKRETRVGVAAVLSFIVLVGVFIANRPAKSKVLPAKEGAASGSPLAIPFPKETESEEKFSPVKKPTEPVVVKVPGGNADDDEPVLPPSRPRDHDPKEFVLASNVDPAGEKLLGDKPPADRPPTPSEPTPPASPDPLPALPTTKPEPEKPAGDSPMPLQPPTSAAKETPKAEPAPTPLPTPTPSETPTKSDLIPTPTPELPKSTAAKAEEPPKPTELVPPASTAPMPMPPATEPPKEGDPVLPAPASTQVPAPAPGPEPKPTPALPDLPKPTEPASPPSQAPAIVPTPAPLTTPTPGPDPKPATPATTPAPTPAAPPAEASPAPKEAGPAPASATPVPAQSVPPAVSPMPTPVEMTPTLVPVPATPKATAPEVKSVGEPAGLPPIGGDGSAPPPVPPVDESPAKPNPTEPATLPVLPATPEIKPEPTPVEQPRPSPAPEPPKAPPAPAPEPTASLPAEPTNPIGSPAPAEPAPTVESAPSISAEPAPMPETAPVASKPLGPGWKKLKNIGKAKIADTFEVDKPIVKAQSIPDAPPPREEFSQTEEVEPVLHTVERGENFWTISRLYYGSGRYYQALWSFNRREVPNIRELYVGSTIKVPSFEKLDRSLIEGPSAPSARPALTSGDSGNGPAKVTRPSTGSNQDVKTIPLRRSRPGVEPDLSLSRPVTRTSSEDVDAPVRPTYRVKPYDTLRGIAKQTLGDARREREILELNRDVISDPRRLTTGQTLTLPEDATTPTRVR